MSEPGAALARIRTESRPHAVALAVALIGGVALASVHWLGLVAAGAAAALVAPSFRRGVAYALAAGALALVTFTVALGSAAPLVAGMRPAVYVTAAGALGLPLLGSLARGVA
ncbi:hypothetical protein [Halorubrum sp. LN27]|uniref:hypothetical protein n=1 Tax=Halorubrum sp. LN27 TaxID=2801032 RepID=UPI00190DCE0D|nr:hypothetical protein [Halorubrum sp. LN27]